MLLEGVFVPLTTPFYRDGALYVRKIEHNVDRISKTPAAGMIVLGPGSEAEGLSDDETREALHAAGITAKKEKVLIAGVSRESVRASLAVAAMAAAQGFDAVTAELPRAVERSTAEALVYFEALADGSPLPLVIWSGLGLKAVPVDWMERLARHANVLGVLDERLDAERLIAIRQATAGVEREVTVTTVFAAVTGRMQVVESSGPAVFVSAESLGGGAAVAVAPPAPALKTRTKKVGFQALACGGAKMLPVLLEGAQGAAPTMAACAPQAVHEVYAAFKDGDPALAAVKAQRVQAAAGLMEELGIAGVKYACDLNGYFGGFPRLPRLPLTLDGKERVDEAMREIRN